MQSERLQRRRSFPQTAQEKEESSPLPEDAGCEFCHDLQELYYQDIRPRMEFIRALQHSSCMNCRILLRAIEELAPTFLEPVELLQDQQEVQAAIAIGPPGVVWLYIAGDSKTEFVKELQFFRTKDMEWSLSGLPTLMDVAPAAGDPSMWAFVKDCMQKCRTQHDSCNSQRYPNWRPDRLVRLSKPDSATAEGEPYSIHLVCSNEYPSKSPYIALSHCWGNKVPLRTLTHNIERFKTNIDFAELPKLFQDCVTVATRLDFSYIWIDALCIIQDDEADWARNVQVMNQVYGNAYLTVGAVGCQDSSSSMLGPATTIDREKSQTVQISAFDFVPHRYNAKARYYDAIKGWGVDTTYLFRRAWAFQERAFSDIYLAFLPNNFEWTCRAQHWTESGYEYTSYAKRAPAQLDDLRDRYENTLHENRAPARLDDLRDGHPDAWYVVVEEYAVQQLSYLRDRLPALSGMAACYHLASKPQYLAGIWTDDYPFCLMWHRGDYDSPLALCQLELELSSQHPSWSWTSIRDQPKWPKLESLGLWMGEELRKGAVERRPIRCAELVEIDCLPTTENIFGQVKRGSSITLRAHVVTAEMECDVHGIGSVIRADCEPQFVTPDCSLGTHTTSKGHRTLTRAPTYGPDQHAERHRINGEVLCLLLFTIKTRGPEDIAACVLILAPHPEFDGAYQRLGIGYGDMSLDRQTNPYPEWADSSWCEDWQKLEKWTAWERWFADSVEMVVKIA